MKGYGLLRLFLWTHHRRAELVPGVPEGEVVFFVPFRIADGVELAPEAMKRAMETYSAHSPLASFRLVTDGVWIRLDGKGFETDGDAQ